MASIFRKNLNLCFSKIRCLPTSLSPPLTLDDEDEDEDEDDQEIVSTHDNPSLSPSISLADSSLSSSSSDFSAILASQRLIISSPGYSNSILDSGAGDTIVGGGVPINKYSPDPYADFRMSMQEMIEAKQREQQQHQLVGDELLEYLQELLLCYLNLNPKHAHKFIIGAFADILLSLMSTHVISV